MNKLAQSHQPPLVPCAAASDIPAHFKIYNVFFKVPRSTGKVTLRGNQMQVEMSRWDLGRIPAASGLHAVNQVWDAVPHVGPALLDASGNPIRSRTIRKRELCVEEVAA